MLHEVPSVPFVVGMQQYVSHVPPRHVAFIDEINLMVVSCHLYHVFQKPGSERGRTLELKPRFFNVGADRAVAHPLLKCADEINQEEVVLARCDEQLCSILKQKRLMYIT